MASLIEDYAIVGDCHTAAMVAKDGSIDWLCLPRFDSGACFASLLGTEQHGRWLIAPAEPIRRISRRYHQGTLVLETEYETESGVVTLIDFMPVRDGHANLVRIVNCTRGHVNMKLEFTLRFDYGTAVPWVRRLPDKSGIRATAGPDTVYFRSPIHLHGEHLTTVGDFEVSAGDRLPFTMTWTQTWDSTPPAIDAEDALQRTEKFWRDWSDQCKYRGREREAVLRSLITLKALTYAPTGGIVAAATTSLPEHIGGVRNWDYRYCWLRDATFTLMALDVGGYQSEAHGWREWLINAVAGTPEAMQIMYSITGERRLIEMELKWLPGYENSKPVRIGNGAYNQHQLDVYGEVIDALYQARSLGLPKSDDAWRIERAILRFLEKHWNEPDEGIWEIRGPRRQFVHSKVMAWVAMDRAVKSVENFGYEGEVEKWRQLRDEIHDQVCDEGFDEELNSFVQFYGSKDPDASLLMLPLVGFLPATDPRIVGTVEYIKKRLIRDGFIERYPTEHGVDGLPPGEGAFLICTFWLADNLALMGRYDEANEIFERLLSLRNDVGLLAEEYDPHRKRLVGNFPQAFSHIGLINTARNLTRHGGPAEHRQE